jgi:hypothetical protein
MKTAQAYAHHIATNMENATLNMPLLTSPKRAIPQSSHEINAYVHQLLNAKEEAVCNGATD